MLSITFLRGFYTAAPTLKVPTKLPNEESQASPATLRSQGFTQFRIVSV